MEIIYILLLLLIIYMVFNSKNSFNDRIDQLESRIIQLQSQLARQQTVEKRSAEAASIPPKVEPPIVTPPVVVPPPAIVKPPDPVEPKEIKLEQPVFAYQEIPATSVTDSLSRIRKQHMPKQPEWQPEPRLSFFERYPDLEKFIGENLINKIGIAILVLAIGFFVKYAIDNNWIGPVGRVGIGVLCGAILLGVAHRMRNSYKSFSSVLVGGGLAVLYFTFTLAYHEFHLFNQTTSFIILIVVTCFAVVLSLLYDKQELAVIALVGGLASPFMVSSGGANYHALFIYLLVLNLGLLVIAYNKSWRILNMVAFGLTIIVFGVVCTTLKAATYHIGFLYASILYLLFFAINIANNVKENNKFIASDFSILLINTALYFATGLGLLTLMHREELRGLFAASLAAVNLLLSYLLFKNKKVDTNILYLLIGITLTFISLAAPIQLHGHYITLFWAAETVLLFWLYQKSGIALMKLTSLIIWGAMIISLFMDWMNLYGASTTVSTVIANKGFITTLFAAVSSYLLFVLISKDDTGPVYGLKVPGNFYKYAAFLLLFMSGLLEINHQFLTRYPATGLSNIYLTLYVPLFVAIIYLLSKKVTALKVDWRVSAALLVAALFFYLILYPQYFDVQYTILAEGKLSGLHFIAHWAGAVCTGVLFYQLIFLAKQYLTDDMQRISNWILSAAVVLFLSLEVNLAANTIFYKPNLALDRITTVYIKTGLPILWGLSSFALMWLGMRYKERTLRIISLTLFSVTLLKLFLFDIQNIPPAGKIAAFFCLGVLLLIISFMYQKVKKIIVDDELPKQD